MSAITRAIATPGTHVSFHCVALSLITTSSLMLLTANQLGPLEMFVVPAGIYLLFMGLAMEVFFGIRHTIARVARIFITEPANSLQVEK